MGKHWILHSPMPILRPPLFFVSGQQQCVDCPPNMYAMLGASKCLPLPNCTDGDIIKAPGDVSACSCDSSPNTACNTTVQPYYMAVKGKSTRNNTNFVIDSVTCHFNFLTVFLFLCQIFHNNRPFLQWCA